jgi:hypothetical protein
VDGVSVGAVGSYTFSNVLADHTIAASFAIDTYTVTASAGAHGSISPAGGVVVNATDDQGFTITADAHYHVADVLVDGVSVGAMGSYTFTNVTAAHTIAASFAIDTYTVTASAGAHGSISPAGGVSVDYGADKTFTITADAHYHVADLLVDGSSVGPVGSYTFTNVTAAHTIAASFAIDTNTITASAAAHGDISPAGGVSVDYGADKTFTITADAHYHVADLLVDGSSVGPVGSYTFSNVTAAHTIAASFAINTYTLTYTAGTGGLISGTSPQTVDYDASGTAVTAVPNAGYHFVKWSDGSTANPRTDTHVMASISVSATFRFNWTGFFQPVDNLPGLNSVKAGQAIPVKFSLGGNQGLNIFVTGYPSTGVYTCGSTANADPITQTVTAGDSSLTYDSSGNQYVYVWKTDKSWSSQCRTLTLKFVDGSVQQANFVFTK